MTPPSLPPTLPPLPCICIFANTGPFYSHLPKQIRAEGRAPTSVPCARKSFYMAVAIDTDPVHWAAVRVLQYTTTLPGAATTAPTISLMTDNMCDKKIYVCTFIARHSLSFTTAQTPVNFCKMLSEDTNGLSRLTM